MNLEIQKQEKCLPIIINLVKVYYIFIIFARYKPEITRKGLMEKLQVRVDFSLYECNGKRILVFEIASRRVGLPIQVDGRYWWRDGDSLVPMPSKVLQAIFVEYSQS